jgi:hypothetical protein
MLTDVLIAGPPKGVQLVLVCLIVLDASHHALRNESPINILIFAWGCHILSNHHGLGEGEVVCCLTAPNQHARPQIFGFTSWQGQSHSGG